MSFPSYALSKLYDWSSYYRQTSFNAGMRVFKSYLHQQPTIRMYVDGTPGMGAQSTSCRILRRIASPDGMAYGGTIEVYYAPGKNADTLKKLYLLLPELANNSNGHIGNAAVQLLQYPPTIALQPVNLGFTGGADSNPDLGIELKVSYFLMLQRYGTDADPDRLNQIQFDHPKWPYIQLTMQATLGYASFGRRAYKIPPPPVPHWVSYNAPAVALIEWLTDERQLAAFDLCVTTGIRFGPLLKPVMSPGAPLIPLFNLITGALASQRNTQGSPAPGAKPVLIVNLDNFIQDKAIKFDVVIDMLAGGPSNTEQVWVESIGKGCGRSYKAREGGSTGLSLLPRLNARRDYVCKQLSALDRVRIQCGGTLSELQESIDWLTGGNNDRVLFLQLTTVPPPVFDYAFSRATLPTVFEGQSSANLALSLGNPYFHVSHRSDATVEYPSTALPLANHGTTATELQRIANMVRSQEWGTVNPAETIGDFIKDYRGQVLARHGQFLDYFHAIRTYYVNDENDKFYTACNFLNYVINGLQESQLQSVEMAEAPAPVDELTALVDFHKKLCSNLVDGTLHLVPGVFSSGQIFDFYKGLFGASSGILQVDHAKITPGCTGDISDLPSDLTEIQVTGTTTAFAGGPAVRVDFTFTAPEGLIVGTGKFTGDISWSPDGLPWIGFADPFITIDTINADVPVAGQIGGTISGVDATISLAYPIADGKWLFAGSFASPPSIAQFFQLAGGINLLQSLPSPLSTFADLGLTSIEFLYDSQAKPPSLEYMTFRIETSQEWPLLSTLKLSNLGVTITVVAPGNTATRKVTGDVTGSFTIGDSKDANAGKVVLATRFPEVRFSGNLVSGEIKINDLLKIFMPGVPLQLPHEPAITVFTLSLDPSNSNYSLNCVLGIGWPIEVSGTTLFTIEGLSLLIESLKGQINGRIAGTFVVGKAVAGDDVSIELSAAYDSAGGWVFEGSQTAGAIKFGNLIDKYVPGLDAGKYIDIDITDLHGTIRTKDTEYTIGGQATWNLPFGDNVKLVGTADVTYGPPPKSAATNGAGVTTEAQLGTQAPPSDKSYSGQLCGILCWGKDAVEISFCYKFAKEPGFPQYAFGVKLGELTIDGLVQPKKNPTTGRDEWIGTLTTQGITLGGAIETLVSWATDRNFGLAAPWDILNHIPLDIDLEFNFTTHKTTLKLPLGIDLGFANLQDISLTYNPNATGIGEDRKVAVSLTGTFLWLDGGKLPPWDATKPETTPAPPGQGNKYFDLRLLALGQHVTLDCFKDASTVQTAIECMKKLPAPPASDSPEIPNIKFAAGSSWLIGADFGILKIEDPKNGNALMRAAEPDAGYVFNLQVVFNDPYIYGLRIAMAGKAAKIFKGLDFQILYQQVSATVGVYRSEITLPDVMRHLTIGAYSVTLPVFGIEVYTNGDFQVDIGFPWNENFTRSFSIEGIIPPGIPVMGSAGFYFGKLSSASSNKMPKAINGTFNPVIVFGFGMQIGFGKSVEYGILSAGFSVTLVGIIEGVLGKWNPYHRDQLQPASDAIAERNSQIQGSYYFWLRGTIGLMGKLYGTIDLAIIKADINVEIKLILQMTYESYVSITITVIASLDVSVSITINLYLFKITIDFSFSMRLKETFAIDNHGTAPWQVAGAQAGTLLQAPADRRLRARREIAALAARTPVERPATNWANLETAVTAAPLSGHLAPALTLAQDEWQAGSQSLKDQLPCYVAMLFIDSVPSTIRDTHTSALKAAGQKSDTAFEALCKMVLRWAIAAIGSGPVTADNVDSLVIHDEDLIYLIDKVLVSTDAMPAPIPGDAIETFLTNQFQMTVKLPPDTNAEADATFFPMAPALKMVIPDTSQISGDVYNYTFADYNEIDDHGLQFLRSYFDKLAVQVQQETAATTAKLTGKKQSMAGWIMTDYFLLLARHMVQAARDALRDFKFPIEDPSDPNHPDTAAGIVAWINEKGQTSAYALHDLFVANLTHELNAGKTLKIGVTYPIAKDGTSFENAADSKEAITPNDLAITNAADSRILVAGTVVTYGQQTYMVQAGDSLLSIARHFKVRFSNELLVNSDVLKKEGLLKVGESLVIPEVSYQSLATDTFDSIAAQAIYKGKFQSTDLARQNAGRSILRAGVQITYRGIVKPYVIQPADCLGDVATHFGVSLDELLDPGRSGVRTQSGLLAPVALLTLPAMPYETGKGETLESVAAKFAMSPDILGAQPINGDIKNLFSTSNTKGRCTPYLDVPHLCQFTVKYLIAEAQRSLALQHLSGMASRYYLHGMRLPTHDENGQPLITPKRVGMWVKKEAESLTLPPYAGLYALTGQQFPLPAIRPFTITFDRSGGPDWLLFDNAGAAPDTLSIEIKPDSPDATRIQKVVEYGHANRLDTGLTVLGAEPMYDSELVTYSLTSTLVWQNADAVTLPYGTPPSGSPSLRLWKLPDAMVNLPDPKTRKINPRFKVQVGRYDEATGGTVKSPVDYYGWASTIEFTVKKIPAVADSAATKSTYEIIGAGGNDIVLMERLLDQVKDNDGYFAQLILGYAPVQTGDATQGVQTDPVASVTLGIAQVNLSTETRPPASAKQEPETSSAQGLLNKKSEFIRLLWEASITRAGGFFLYYYNQAESGGLPDRIFNDKGEASLTLIVIYSQPGLTDFMNAVATAVRIDTSNTVVFAQAAPLPAQIPASGTDSLASIAYDYYSNVGDLAAANASLALAGGAKVKVSEGLYQVTPNAPGGNLGQIAAHFQLGNDGVQKIKEANPRRIDWPDPLPLYTAIRLPQIEVTVGTSAGGTSLSSIAAFYGANLTALAAHNQHVAFAVGLPVSIPGGPRVRSATVPPGVEAVMAARPVPAATPSDPTAVNFARDFLQNTFSLLNYQVVENVDFKGSNLGLPAGPTSGPSDPENHDKIRMPQVLVPAKHSWQYKQAMPFPQYAKQEAGRIDGLPNGQSPYDGIGRILQVNFAWQDYYGNTLVTDLSNPQAGDKNPLNRPPLLTGYADALIGLGQWPSVASNWQVLGAAGKPQLEVLLNFDDSRYQGLLMAKAFAATTVVATFTQALEKTSAEDKTNYTVNGAPVNAAVLDPDEMTVTLTLKDSLKDENTLSIRNIKRKTAPEEREIVYEGQAGFSYPNVPGKCTSTVQESAEKDLRIYSRLFYQLNDKNGIAYSIESSLLKQSSLPVIDDAPLIHWLFGGGPASSIYQFIEDRRTFGVKVPSPTPQLKIKNNLALDQLNDSQILVLSLSFVIRRLGGAVLGDLETTPGIRQTATQIAPLTAKLAANTLGLSQFATNFEAACQQPGVYQLKVATGVDRTRLASERRGNTVWAVRLGLTGGQGISYTIGNENEPALFAPQPISNTLESRTGVAIKDYTTGKGISLKPTRTIDFADIDMDLWGRLFLGAIDGVLSPLFTAAIQLVDKEKGTKYLSDILAEKKLLAGIVSRWMIPVFKGELAHPASAQEAFYQQLLARLSNAYSTRAAIEFKANVHADTQIEGIPPRLFGNVVQNDLSGDISLTSPKLVLQTKSDEPLTFLLSASDTIKSGGGEVVPFLTLDLTYEGSNIEHQVTTLPGIQEYQASSWLHFVISDAGSPLTRKLGRFDVPMVLRAFPTSPTLTGQIGAATRTDGTLNELTQWTYNFIYSLPFHYPQDVVYCEVEFNLKAADLALKDFKDAFNQLAQFVTVFPEVKKDFEEIVSTIDATLTDKAKINEAAIAIDAFLTLVRDVQKAASGPAGLTMAEQPREFTGDSRLTFYCNIQEGSTTINDKSDVLLVSIIVTKPGGIDIGKVPPVVEIEGYSSKPHQGTDCDKMGRDGQEPFCYVYEKKDQPGKYLSAKDGQPIAKRQLKLPAMDILERQDARTTVYITRNEILVPGKRTAEQFIYTTAEVQFANPLHPTIDTSKIVDIAKIPSNDSPIHRSLKAHLDALFDALLLNNTQERLTFQVEATYSYSINPNIPPVPLPLLMQAPLDVQVLGETSQPPTRDQMLSEWSAAITHWFKQHTPAGTDGTLRFDLTIMSDLTKQPMPLLRLRGLELPIAYITPPLDTAR